MALSKIEQEAIILYAVLDMIGDMVNFAIFERPVGVKDTNLIFKDGNARDLFAILLTDFLSQPQSKGDKPLPFDLPRPSPTAKSSDRTYLLYLRQVIDDPKLSTDASMIANVINRFACWLDGQMTVPKVWLSRISVEIDLTIERIEFVKLTGNLSKHNFARLEADVRKIKRVVKASGVEIDDGQAYIALEDIKEWFKDDIFFYHASTMAEFLNDLRYAIHRYLAPEFARSMVDLGDLKYRYTYPAGVEASLAKEMYWELMNMVRSGIHFPKFEVTPYLKLRY